MLSAEAFDRLDAPTVVRAEELSDEEAAAFATPFVRLGGVEGLDGSSARTRFGLDDMDGA